MQAASIIANKKTDCKCIICIACLKTYIPFYRFFDVESQHAYKHYLYWRYPIVEVAMLLVGQFFYFRDTYLLAIFSTVLFAATILCLLILLYDKDKLYNSVLAFLTISAILYGFSWGYFAIEMLLGAILMLVSAFFIKYAYYVFYGKYGLDNSTLKLLAISGVIIKIEKYTFFLFSIALLVVVIALSLKFLAKSRFRERFSLPQETLSLDNKMHNIIAISTILALQLYLITNTFY